MALPDYFQRGAVAVAQVIAGFDESAIRNRLESVVLGISVSTAAAHTVQGTVAAELLVRLAARMYPAIKLDGPSDRVASLSDLARSINPDVELSPEGATTVSVSVGGGRHTATQPTIYVGSSALTARVTTKAPASVGRSVLPFGAGAGACLAMAAIFRHVFMDAPLSESEVDFPVVPGGRPPERTQSATRANLAFVGVGAVGNGAVWAISKLPEPPLVDLIDPEVIELSNLQRYVLARRDQVGIAKVEVAREALPDARVFQSDLTGYLNAVGFIHEMMAVSVDSARGRVAAQASLPKVVVNGWTQPGDLGVSAHSFLGDGACLACLYLPKSVSPSEDAVYARALGVPEQQPHVRNLLYSGQPVPAPLLTLIGQRLGIDEALMSPFADKSIRELYREGLCGGAVLPIGAAGTLRQDVHVPLPHQSALAGIMLAARCFILAATSAHGRTVVSRVDVLKPVNPAFMNQLALKDSRGLCICQDSEFISAYAAKYGQ
jgi:hypothetical protein